MVFILRVSIVHHDSGFGFRSSGGRRDFFEFPIPNSQFRIPNSVRCFVTDFWEIAYVLYSLKTLPLCIVFARMRAISKIPVSIVIHENEL